MKEEEIYNKACEFAEERINEGMLYDTNTEIRFAFERGAEWMQEQKRAEIDAINTQVNEDTYELAYQAAIDKCWKFLAEQCVGDDTFVFTENDFIKAMKGE